MTGERRFYGWLYAALMLGALCDCTAAPAPLPEPPAVPEPAAPSKLIVTDDTVVTLDGVRCKFADVPGAASVVALEVAADKKTILKIAFATKKP